MTNLIEPSTMHKSTSLEQQFLETGDETSRNFERLLGIDLYIKPTQTLKELILVRNCEWSCGQWVGGAGQQGGFGF